MSRLSLLSFLLLPGLAFVGACDEPAPIDEECGALPEFGCNVDGCDPTGGAARDCAVGATLYQCVDITWEEVGTCDPDLLVVDGAWAIDLAAELDAACPDVDVWPLTFYAAHPEGTQDLTLTAPETTFGEESLLIAIDRGNASFAYAGIWRPGVSATGDFDLSLAHDGTITGTAQLFLTSGAEACDVTFDVTGTFEPGWYQP